MKCVIRLLLGLTVLGLLFPVRVSAQPYVRLQPTRVTGTLDATTTSLSLSSQAVGSFGSVKIQVLDTYSGTWEVQCSLDGTTFDTDNELTLMAIDGTAVVYEVIDDVGIWDVTNAAGCHTIRVIETAGFAATNATVIISATQSGGGNGGGGGSGGGAVTQSGPWNVDAVITNAPTVLVGNLGPTAETTYATTACYKTSTASTNATSCADAPANYYGIEYAINTTTTAAYLHIYNNAGSPTCNANIIATIPIPAASAAGVFGGVALPAIIPTSYATGIGICITGAADGTTNAPVGVYVKLNYKE